MEPPFNKNDQGLSIWDGIIDAELPFQMVNIASFFIS